MGTSAPAAPGQVALARLALLEACASGCELAALVTAQGARNAASAWSGRGVHFQNELVGGILKVGLCIQGPCSPNTKWFFEADAHDWGLDFCFGRWK